VEAVTALADFLLARIAEDAAASDEWHNMTTDDFGALQTFGECECGGKARVLAECEAKRRIVADYADAISENLYSEWGQAARYGLHRAITALAQPYADHPEFREEWRVG
jgi:hypothetical protein